MLVAVRDTTLIATGGPPSSRSCRISFRPAEPAPPRMSACIVVDKASCCTDGRCSSANSADHAEIRGRSKRCSDDGGGRSVRLLHIDSRRGATATRLRNHTSDNACLYMTAWCRQTGFGQRSASTFQASRGTISRAQMPGAQHRQAKLRAARAATRPQEASGEVSVRIPRLLKSGAALCVCACLALALAARPAPAAEFPAAKEGHWTAGDFRFHTGEVMPELRIGYRTVGDPSGEPVLMLHGTAGSGAGMLTPDFAGELFGAGQALDAGKHFIILPDAIGAGKSSKPSDGLRTKFPRYNYDDMVEAQHRLVTEGLGIKHLRLVMGNSMGGMHTWIWGIKHPTAMDALVPMASQPTEMSSRNWMMRRMLIDAVRNDPDWNGGNYTTQPRALKVANAFFGIA